jgi:hypothetical protein
MRLLACFAGIVLLVGACRAKAADGPPCGTIAGKFFTLANDELTHATVDPTTHRLVLDQLPALRDALDQACSDGAWSKDVRMCLANAPDHAAFQACEQQLTTAQRDALRRAGSGETHSP